MDTRPRSTEHSLPVRRDGPAIQLVKSANVPDGHDVIEVSPSTAATQASPKFLSRESSLWLMTVVLLIVTGLFKGINLLVLLAYLLAGIWLFNQVVLRSIIRRISAKRLPTGHVFAGEPVECSIELTYAGKRPARGIVIVDSGEIPGTNWLVLSMTKQAPLRLRHTRVFPSRGRWHIDALRARSSFPFGLATRTVDLAPAEQWIVLPRLGRVRVDRMKQWLERIIRGDGRTRRRVLLPSPQEADIHGLRDFRLGDSPRWIHWKTSARRNQLLVREFEDSAQPHLALVIEPWLPAKTVREDRKRLDELISLAGTIVRDWCRDPAARLTLVLTGKEPLLFENGSGGEFASRMLEVLALESGHSDTTTIAWLQSVRPGLRNIPFLVLSSNTDSTLQAEIGGELGRPIAGWKLADTLDWYEPPAQAMTMTSPAARESSGRFRRKATPA